MRSILSVLLAASFALAQQNSFSINTPTNAVVCQPLLLAWQGGTRPYFLSVLNGNDPTGTALEDLGQQNGTSLTWQVNQPAGTALGLTLRDSTGLVAQSASFTVNPGSDTSCLGKAASTSAGATSPATTPVGTGATSAASGTAKGTSAANTATSGTAVAPSATTTKNAALANAAQVGSVGIFGAALVALLA